ncbi:WD40 repeat-like protein [Penicillium angulare]|uniref:WD40 repeat-like protein n=1 Tax=Penicillium angulare TaxID=116970 RepID=A0A9W9EV09_9EURO|nr:WD40 repeat-like protein [Penicillium angulare]
MSTSVNFEGSNLGGLQVGVNYGNINSFDHPLPIVEDAIYGSYRDRNEDECLPGTRTALLAQVNDWISSTVGPYIFLLNGMAGTGKSTISRTIAMTYKNPSYLSASFFFKRSEEHRGNAKHLFPTLIYQMMNWSSEIQAGVNDALRRDPKIASMSLSEQFEQLILQPLLRLDQASHEHQSRILVIVVDALDECDHEQDIQTVIRLFSDLQRVRAVRLRVFLTSRPEQSVRLGFADIAFHYQHVLLHEIPEEVTKHDIELFLNDRFTKIRRKRNMSQAWPSKKDMNSLVEMSEPLFISAATVCRYIEGSKLSPIRRLSEILKDQVNYGTRMEKTYMPLLNHFINTDQDEDVPESEAASERQQLLREFNTIIGTIILLATPLSVNTLSRLLGTSITVSEVGSTEDLVEYVSDRLDAFHSVLRIPHDRDSPIRILHLSFRDFLLQGASVFHVDGPSKHMAIFQLCLETMERHLRYNVCDLDSPGTEKEDIDPQSVHRQFSSELAYSCRFWTYHFQQVSNDIETSAFLYDAKRFLLRNHQIANLAPLQIYYAGLLFAPQNSLVRRELSLDLLHPIDWISPTEKTWGSELQILEGHTKPVFSVVFSPDGKLLATTSSDDTLRVWNVSTGMPKYIIYDLYESGSEVNFSSDGRTLVSTKLETGSVQLWDAATGTPQKTIQPRDRLNPIDSFSISPDDQFIALSRPEAFLTILNIKTGALEEFHHSFRNNIDYHKLSPNGRLILWSFEGDKWITDARTNQVLVKFEAKGTPVFSPDGQYLVFFLGKKIFVHEILTGTLKYTRERHSRGIRRLILSPNGRLIASQSDEDTIYVWNTKTGALYNIIHNFNGPSDVKQILFSDNGQLIVSSSYDGNVMVWDTTTGVLRKRLSGYTLSTSIAFSPDSRILALCASGGTVRLWDISMDAQPQEHAVTFDRVKSMAFSTDSQLLVSGTNYGTVKLWDATTGASRNTYYVAENRLATVALSPDGQRLASASDSRGVQIWDSAMKEVQMILCCKKRVCSLAFSYDGELLAVATWDILDSSGAESSDEQCCGIEIFDIASGRLQQTVCGGKGEGATHETNHRSEVAVAFSPDGNTLTSVSHDMTIRVWDVATGALQLESTTQSCRWIDYLTMSYSPLNGVSRSDPFPCRSLDPSHQHLDVMLHEDTWIVVKGKKILWLPPKYRPICSLMSQKTLALGHMNGSVSFLRFDMDYSDLKA